MKRNIFLYFFALSALLGGCSDVADTLGFGRNPPDEFAVVDRPPLSLPPDFDLRPPRPGAPRPQEEHATKRASVMLFGSGAHIANTPDRNSLGEEESVIRTEQSEAEKFLIKNAGGDKADPAIRDIVDREAAQRVVSSRHLVDELLWWRKTEPPATVVDAAAEAERIEKAKENNEPINKGATPIIERKKPGWLGL